MDILASSLLKFIQTSNTKTPLPKCEAKNYFYQMHNTHVHITWHGGNGSIEYRIELMLDVKENYSRNKGKTFHISKNTFNVNR